MRAVTELRELARAQRRTAAVVLCTAVAAFLAAWWLTPVAGGSTGTLASGGAGASPSPGVATSVAHTGAAVEKDAAAGESDAGSAGAARGSSRSLFVHVSGAVAKPGLVEVADGARVFDAIAQAGGVTAEAREGGVNLARFVVDGEQILVPRADDPAAAPGPDPASSASGSSAASGAALPGAGGKVNLNTATAAELETLPRVGPSMSAKILAWRAENGAFSSIEDLNDVDGVGDKTFESLKDLVTL
jgi:competence protein ComEA